MRFFTRSVPLHFFLVAAYAIVVAANGLTGGSDGGDFDWNQRLFELPLFGSGEGENAASITITPLAVIIIFGFVAQWLEAIRATRVAGTARNDIWSLILAVITLVLFVGVGPFQTFAFFVIVIVAFGDVLLDRIIGQAVAQRDFGGIVPGMDAN